MRKIQLIAFWMILLMFPSGSTAAKPDKKQLEKTLVTEKKEPAADDSARQAYYQELKKKIFKCAYKNYSSRQEGNVFLDFTVLANGKIKDVRVDKTRSKANSDLKKIAVKSVMQASAFDPFPKALKDYSELEFNIEISFKNPAKE